MPTRRATFWLVLSCAGAAHGQQAVPGPQPGSHAHIRTALGDLDLHVANPAARTSAATLRDLAPGKQARTTQTLTLTSRVILRADADARRVLSNAGYTLVPAPAGYHTIETGSVAEAAALADAIAGLPGVVSATVDARAPLTARNTPNDPLYNLAWHLFNEDDEGHDINAQAAWKMGYTGQGITIGVIDSGVWSFHPDMPGTRRNNEASQNGASSSHGTGVAGVAMASADNNQGSAGLAHSALYANLYYSPSGDTVVNTAAFALRNDLTHIKNNSWGPFDNGALRSLAAIESDAILDAVTTGRQGKGTIFVWAAGNGGAADRVDYDPYASSPYTIAIGAITDSAKRANYSERGSSLFAVTYSSGNPGVGDRDIVTTNNTSASPYNFNFGGTSSAAPLASAAIALCLEANPSLTWRDVQHLIVQTAEPVDTADADWTTNGAGIPINHSFGFGQLDAALMLEAALDWTPVAPQISYDAGEVLTSLAIPDNDPQGVSVQIDAQQDLVIEHVAIDVQAAGTFIGDLSLVLTSPAGTQSILHAQHTNSADAMNHTFHSVRHWGEHAEGVWTLTVADLAADDTHTLSRVALRFMGTEPVPCIADQNDDGLATPDDFQAWLTNYMNADITADANQNGSLEPADFSAWIAAYNIGC